MSKEGAFIMAHRKVVAGLSGFLIALAAVLGLGVDVMSKPLVAAENSTARADLIMIDTIAQQRELEMPASQFMHDKHTAALKEQDKDCSTCHKTTTNEEGKKVMSLKFMREEDGSADELKKIYHDGCISCHAKDKADGAEKYGPQSGECRSCHVDEPEYTAEREDIEMDNALHYIHWGSKQISKDAGEETNCGSCHHQWDEQTQKLVYKKFEEESCSYCHTEAPKEPVKTPERLAFHEQCVVCHQTLAENKAENYGPVECAGCHSEKAQEELKQSKDEMLQKLGGVLPRLPRQQPDAVLMTPPVAEDATMQEKEKVEEHAMPVAFNHKFHEQNTDSCAACHHKSVQSCDTCHTPRGDADGEFVSLAQSMHQADSMRSCVGCHQQEQKKPECAGCHAAMEKKAQPASDSCATCHEPLQSAGEGMGMMQMNQDDMSSMMNASESVTTPLPEGKDAREALARRIIERRPDTPRNIDINDVPETVTIGVLSDEYKPSEMPHRKIVKKLMEDMDNDKLAAAFHTTELTMCQGCHHNSPASVKPPRCESCHGKPFMEQQPGRPGLKAAFHAQCMDCHKQMQLEKPVSTNCTACHEKKD